MFNNWKHIRIILITGFFVFLVISFLMLITISHLPASSLVFRTRLLILLFILSLFGMMLFIFSISINNNIKSGEISSNGNESESKPELATQNLPDQTQIKTKQGRLVKKLKNLLAHIDTGSVGKLGDSCLSALAKDFEIVQGLFYSRNSGSDIFEVSGKYAWYAIEPPPEVKYGESLTGQAIKDGKMVHIDNIPENYISVLSGLGTSSPNHLYIIPLIKEGMAWGVIELASFKEFDHYSIQVFQTLAEHIAGALEDLSLKK
jgi:hypothetical protein